jgi:hypothetical protein
MEQPLNVQWAQIEAECDGYRAGFVAVFRKYEGQSTDEKDAQGRIVKVTASSFALHMGVAITTFKGWMKQIDGVRRSGLQPSQTPATTRTGQMGRQIAKSPTTTVDDKVGMLEDLISDKKVLKAYREKRAPDVSEHDAKAAEAAAEAFAHTVGQSFTGLEVPMWINEIKDITKTLSEYEYDEDTITKLAQVVRKLMDEIEIQQFRLGLIEEVQ